MTFLRTMAGVLAIAACGTEPGHRVNLGEVVGGWVVTLTEPPTCGRNNPAPALFLDISTLGRTGEDTVALQGKWGVGPITNPTLDLLGRLDLRTGEFHADLTGTEPTLVGRLAGSADPLLGAGSCTYTAFGQQ
ncbi:MAG: hypothetical protein ACREM9_01215 [Gemmatimonadales bacterium]